ncbi:MAG: class I SAM-dependent methyltransferase [Gammaproteobacteria bacterium]|nr:class I SAM-dependent methyltransferase [Gammaproteobacteria bacterium]
MSPRFTADSADKFVLYQKAVQSAEQDIEFLNDTYKSIRGREPRHLREDFCGTCLLSANWIKLDHRNTAESYDIDPEPLEWGRLHNLAPLGNDKDRVVQYEEDARNASRQAPDVRCAQNFSYWVFKTRAEMLTYFKGVQEDLAEEGIFVVDLHGGPESIQELEEETEMDDESFTYVWDQDKINPITGEALMHIHFRFPDGTEMSRAFSYDWRQWSIPELSDVFMDAGFSRVDCYWEGTDEDGESGDGVFSVSTEGEACLSYVAYLVGQK